MRKIRTGRFVAQEIVALVPQAPPVHLGSVQFNPLKLVPHANSSAPEFMDLPKPLRLAVVARLSERRHQLTKVRSRLKQTVDDDAKLLGIHVATLEREQSAAKEAGFIRISFDYTVTGPDLRADAEAFVARLEQPPKLYTLAADLEHALQTRGLSGRRFKALRVIRCGRESGRAKRRMERFAALAAHLLMDVLQPAKLVGVTWGPTLKCVLDACHPAKAIAPYARIFPLTGATPDIEDEDWISSNIVASLEQRGGTRARPLTLQGVWPAVPAAAQSQIIIDAMRATPDYRIIFGTAGAEGLADKMDTVLTSIGRVEKPWGMGRGIMARIVELKGLKELTFGDIGGVLLPRRNPQLDSTENAAFKILQDSWIGLTAEHLRAVVDRAASKSETSGVCVLSTGAAKAEVLLWAIELGMVSQAIVDEALALKLARLLHVRVQ